MKYEKETVDKIVAALMGGSTRLAAAKAGGVSKDTFYEWLKRFSDFADSVKRAEEFAESNMVPEVKASLYQRAVGYTVTEKKTEYGERNGMPVIIKQTVSEKSYPPDVAAAIFILTNKDAANWKNRTSTDAEIKVQGDTETRVSLESVPDDLLEQVVKAIKGESD